MCEYNGPNLQSHIKLVHEGKILKCSICEYKVKTTKRMKIHMRLIHEGENAKIVSCTLCDYKTTEKNVSADFLCVNKFRL